MHPEQLKADIRMAGTTPAIIADELGVTRATVSQVIHGRSVSARIQGHISEIIGKPIEAIWKPAPKLRREQA